VRLLMGWTVHIDCQTLPHSSACIQLPAHALAASSAVQSSKLQQIAVALATDTAQG